MGRIYFAQDAPTGYMRSTHAEIIYVPALVLVGTRNGLVPTTRSSTGSYVGQTCARRHHPEEAADQLVGLAVRKRRCLGREAPRHVGKGFALGSPGPWRSACLLLTHQRRGESLSAEQRVGVQSSDRALQELLGVGSRVQAPPRRRPAEEGWQHAVKMLVGGEFCVFFIHIIYI